MIQVSAHLCMIIRLKLIAHRIATGCTLKVEQTACAFAMLFACLHILFLGKANAILFADNAQVRVYGQVGRSGLPC